VWEALEIDGRTHNARDTKTGAVMEVRGTPEIDVKRVIVRLPRVFVMPFFGSREFGFLVSYRPASDGNANLRLSVGSFQDLVRKRHGSFADNTQFVRYLIQGLAAINRKWPLCKNPKFFSNLSDYKKKNILTPEFDFPSDEELAQL
jgi:hypothetical protein